MEPRIASHVPIKAAHFVSMKTPIGSIIEMALLATAVEIMHWASLAMMTCVKGKCGNSVRLMVVPTLSQIKSGRKNGQQTDRISFMLIIVATFIRLV